MNDDDFLTAGQLFRSVVVGTTIALVLFIVFLCGQALFGAEIKGDVAVKPGSFNKLESDTPGAWAIFPDRAGSWAADSNERVFYYAISQPGTYTAVLFSVVDNKPAITQFTFDVGAKQDDDEVIPPDDLDLTAQERALLSGALKAVVAGIESGGIRTPQTARATFRQTIAASGAPSAAIQTVLAKWSLEAISTLDELKKTFEKLQKQLEIRMESTNDCPTGTCPVK